MEHNLAYQTANNGNNLGMESQSKCKKVLKNLWVKFCGFLYYPDELTLFATEEDLRKSTGETGKVFPRRSVPKDSPLKSLLAYNMQKRLESLIFTALGKFARRPI